MDSETRLSSDFEPYIDQARKLRGEYIAKILRGGFAALFGPNQKTAKPATYPSKSGDFCSQA
jgi:hypothetical protein